MGLFSRRRDDPPGPPDDSPPVPDDDDRPLVPEARALRDTDRALRDRCLVELAEAGVDLDSVEAIGAAYDAECAAWVARRTWRRDEHEPYVQRWGVAIGEHLVRRTDLRWTTVADVFGTDLGLMADDDDLALVPVNLVSGRWLNGERGWVPGVVAHLVRLRSR